MSAPDLTSLSIAELGAAFRRGDASPLEAVDACLERIEALDGQVLSFITLTAEDARARARVAADELSRGTDRGPLHGVPMGLKDLYATKGVRTTAHSRVLLNSIPDEDATAVARLYDAGALSLGKLAMHEFAFGGPDATSAFPPARNPWNLAHIPGGSSSGSGAALAARFCYGALGSDTGGSIRGPAHNCSISGLKPTYGRVSRFGVVPLSWSLDHCGPMARTAFDCALMLQALAGYDPRDAASADLPVPDYTAGIENSVRGMRLGVPRDWLGYAEGTDPEIVKAFEEALATFKDLGAELIDMTSEPLIDAGPITMVILLAEAYAFHEKTVKEQPQNYGKTVHDRVLEGAFLSAADYIQALRARTAIAQAVREKMANLDAIVCPGGPKLPALLGNYDGSAMERNPMYTRPFNLTGMPSLTVPCGFSASGLPIGLQISGKAWDEAGVLRLGHAFQKSTSWHTRAPEIAQPAAA